MKKIFVPALLMMVSLSFANNSFANESIANGENPIFKVMDKNSTYGFHTFFMQSGFYYNIDANAKLCFVSRKVTGGLTAIDCKKLEVYPEIKKLLTK